MGSKEAWRVAGHFLSGIWWVKVGITLEGGGREARGEGHPRAERGAARTGLELMGGLV